MGPAQDGQSPGAIIGRGGGEDELIEAKWPRKMARKAGQKGAKSGQMEAEARAIGEAKKVPVAPPSERSCKRVICLTHGGHKRLKSMAQQIL